MSTVSTLSQYAKKRGYSCKGSVSARQNHLDLGGCAKLCSGIADCKGFQFHRFTSVCDLLYDGICRGFSEDENSDLFAKSSGESLGPRLGNLIIEGGIPVHAKKLQVSDDTLKGASPVNSLPRCLSLCSRAGCTGVAYNSETAACELYESSLVDINNESPRLMRSSAWSTYQAIDFPRPFLSVTPPDPLDSMQMRKEAAVIGDVASTSISPTGLPVYTTTGRRFYPDTLVWLLSLFLISTFLL